MQVYVEGVQVGEPTVSTPRLFSPSLQTLWPGHMVDSAAITGMAAVCNRYMGPTCLPGEASSTHSRGQQVDVQNFLPALQLSQGGVVAKHVRTVSPRGQAPAGHALPVSQLHACLSAGSPSWTRSPRSCRPCYQNTSNVPDDVPSPTMPGTAKTAAAAAAATPAPAAAAA